MASALARQRPISGVTVDLKDALESGKVRDRLRRRAVGRVDIGDRWRVGSAPRQIHTLSPPRSGSMTGGRDDRRSLNCIWPVNDRRHEPWIVGFRALKTSFAPPYEHCEGVSRCRRATWLTLELDAKLSATIADFSSTVQDRRICASEHLNPPRSDELALRHRLVVCNRHMSACRKDAK